jgi:plastocyanin
MWSHGVGRRSIVETAGVGTVAVLIATLLLAAPASASTTYYVTNSSDSGAGSLRQAITDANANAGADTIAFSISGTGIQTISPTSALPAITDPVTIDATTQTGYAGTPLIDIDGTGAGSATGLNLAASDSEVKGLAITDFALAGISVSGNNDAIEGDYVGVAPDGTTTAANSGDGIDVVSSTGGVTVGGTSAGMADLIENNAGAGIEVSSAASGVSIRGDEIDANGGLGILLDSGGNGDQAAPSVTSASRDATSTYLRGSLSSTPSSSFNVDFYASASCDPSGSGEGDVFLGTTVVTTDGTGNGGFDFRLGASAPASSQITATATSQDGSTSGYSSCLPVTDTGQIVTVANYAFTPSVSEVGQGQAVEWDFQGPSSHTATDISGMSLYNSGSRGPGATFSYEFDSAGTYRFHCAIHTFMVGEVKVPTSAVKGLYGRINVTWSSASAASGFVFDVQVKKPGVKGWHAWKSGTASTGASYSPKSHGTYRFRARLRELSNGKASGWSPATSVKF